MNPVARMSHSHLYDMNGERIGSISHNDLYNAV